jgi:hypothetical protein
MAMNTTSPNASGRGAKPRTPKRSAGANSAKANLNRYPDRWIKSPVRGYCPETGLTRAAFYQLADLGKIKTACIRKPGAIRGNRLFHLGSVLAFLDATAVETAAREVKA